MEVTLSTVSIQNAIKKLNKLESDLKQTNQKIIEDMATFTENEVDKNLRLTFYKDGNEDAYAFKEIGDGEAIVGMRGSQVLYDEFGTGIIGAQNPHPEKGKYGLNSYASGSKINPNTMYWKYYKDGKFHTTQGIPAGMQVYNAKNALLKRSKEITRERIGEALSKL